MPAQTLQGVVTIVSAGAETHTFTAPSPNTLPILVTQEVFIIVTSTLGAVNLQLPSISTLGTYGVKINVINLTGATLNNVTITAFAGGSGLAANLINGVATNVITVNGTSRILNVVSDNNWHLA
jgi:hypothetical protein